MVNWLEFHPFNGIIVESKVCKWPFLQVPASKARFRLTSLLKNRLSFVIFENSVKFKVMLKLLIILKNGEITS